MMRRIILIVLIAAALTGVVMLFPRVDQQRKTLAGKSIYGTTPEEPEIVLLTNVLGGFKGLLVDAAWLRATRLQRDGEFWELLQLCDWIGKLEPRIEEVWVFNGWNMSYNLVAQLDQPEARWQWIERGIELMRDQGLKYNPRSGKIMEQIAWTFWHKIGKDSDYYHWYYKHRWALVMYGIMGNRSEQDIPGIAAAPDSLAELLEDTDVADAFKVFRLDPPDELLKVLDKVNIPVVIQIPKDLLLALDKNIVAKKKVRNYITRRILRDTFKMDRFDVMLDIEREYGKFDWRLPEPHALYWSTLALEVEQTEKKMVNYERLVVYALQETYRRGRVAHMGFDLRYAMFTYYDLSKIPVVDKLYDQMLSKYPPEFLGVGQSWRDGHMHFLQEATRELYFAGYREEAKKYFNRLRKLYGRYMENNLDEYVLGQIKLMVDEYGTRAKIEAVMNGLLREMLMYYASNQMDAAYARQQLANRMWDAYREYQIALASSQKIDPNLPEFKELERYVIIHMLSAESPIQESVKERLRILLNLPPDAGVEQLPPGGIDIPPIDFTSPLPE